ncbi:hypothetical protein ACLOJK_004108 [Asimina triloba]
MPAPGFSSSKSEKKSDNGFASSGAKQQRRDPYEVLGISKYASDQEIKTAYRKMALSLTKGDSLQQTTQQTIQEQPHTLYMDKRKTELHYRNVGQSRGERRSGKKFQKNRCVREKNKALRRWERRFGNWLCFPGLITKIPSSRSGEDFVVSDRRSKEDLVLRNRRFGEDLVAKRKDAEKEKVAGNTGECERVEKERADVNDDGEREGREEDDRGEQRWWAGALTKKI